MEIEYYLIAIPALSLRTTNKFLLKKGAIKMEMKNATVSTEKKGGYISRLCKNRINSASKYRSLDKEAEDYTNYYQGARLSPASVKALGRA